MALYTVPMVAIGCLPWFHGGVKHDLGNAGQQGLSPLSVREDRLSLPFSAAHDFRIQGPVTVGDAGVSSNKSCPKSSPYELMRTSSPCDIGGGTGHGLDVGLTQLWLAIRIA